MKVKEKFDIENIKKKLIVGDYITISKMVKCSTKMVAYVFQGRRNYQTPTGYKIVRSALALIESREDLISKMQETL